MENQALNLLEKKYMAKDMLTAVFLLLLLAGIQCICPPECDCELDIRGRRLVSCVRGGMQDPIPITHMDAMLEVLKISAPESNQNALTIGPIFQQFSQLEEVHIVRSNVPAIGKHSFWGVPSLKVLNLTQNNISQVVEYNFQGLMHLEKLHLDDNRIESMHSGTFRKLPELRILSLARNRIKELAPRQFLSLAKLTYLDLSGNPLVDLNPEVFKDVQEIRVFACRGCMLKNINTHIYSLLSSLIKLDLGDNDFKYIASDEFRDLKRLQELRLDGNHLPVVLERTFSWTPKLQVLSLARNRLAKVTTAAFLNLTTLTELDLSYNKLDRAETLTFQPLADSLRTLYIGGNNIPITELKYVLQVVVKLKSLSLADLGLTDIPLGLLVYLEHLRFLNFSGNNMMHFPSQVLAPVPKLNELDLSRNSFYGLDDRLLIRLESVGMVHLHGNPWSCDHCHINWMLNRLDKLEYLRNVVCAHPYSVKGMTLASLDRDSLEWCSPGPAYREEGVIGLSLTHTTKLGFLAAGAAVILLIISSAVIVLTLFYSRHHAAYYYTHEEKRGPEHDSIFENHGAVIEDGLKPKKVSIATIDEITKDPDLQIVANGS